jgi:uncharacterized spore protein YtfJ
MAVDVRQIIEEARDVMTGRRVYSEPYERNGVTVILASRVQGGGGGGAGEGHGQPEGHDPQSGSGWGGGFGLNARPVGAFVIRGDDVRFVPALDVTRIIAGGQLVALAALLTLRVIVRARAKRKG